ncbi:MAG: hypothetical protein ACOCRX_01900 [Candidatus Woesearchaeota archaeon]
MKIKRKKGAFDVAIASVVGLMLIIGVFYNSIYTNIENMKYDILSQYGRDALLILESKDEVSRSYLTDIKVKLSSKLIYETGEYIKVYVIIDGIEYDSESMPSTVKTIYGEPIKIKIDYHYTPRRLDLTNLAPKKDTSKNERIMGINLQTICRNRGVSDD